MVLAAVKEQRMENNKIKRSMFDGWLNKEWEEREGQVLQLLLDQGEKENKTTLLDERK